MTGIRCNPDQADGLHGYSQFLAAMGRIKESLAMRDHLQAVEPFIINYTADTAEIYWLDGATEKAVAMLEPFRPGRTLELALVEASAGRYREAAAALREMPAWNYPPGMLEAAATVLDSAPTKAAARDDRVQRRSPGLLRPAPRTFESRAFLRGRQAAGQRRIARLGACLGGHLRRVSSRARSFFR